MSNQSIKAVLLDYGGVIAEEGFRNELVVMAREQGIGEGTILGVARREVYESGFVLGWGTEETFWAAMREGAGLRGSDAELTKRVLDALYCGPGSSSGSCDGARRDMSPVFSATRCTGWTG